MDSGDGFSRRRLLKGAAALPVLGFAPREGLAQAVARVRPGDPAWPDAEAWDGLSRAVGGNLLQPRTIWGTCAEAPGTPQCLASLKDARNPFALGDNPGGTQVSGWLNAWTPKASAYAVAARSADDVVAAVNFARRRHLRLVVKGGGHSYLGGSNAADSLLIWTRAMNGIELHDAFTPEGGGPPPTPAVSVGAGCVWIDVYAAVTTHAGRYVQGGGCASVGVAGLVQGGGFGSFSKRYGLAGASLLQAEIVTADGELRIVNARQDADLFWALKGGGGGSFGVVTKLTLQTHELPELFGAAAMKIKAASPEAYRRLVGRLLDHYAAALFNPAWGEQMRFGGDEIEVAMVCAGLEPERARADWAPFVDFVRAAPADFTFAEAPKIGVGPARRWWDAAANPSLVRDARLGAAPDHAWWRGDQDQASMFIHAAESQWLPASLLAADQRGRLADALVAAAQHAPVELHVNKGLAGAAAEVNAAARRCAINPAVADAFCLAIVAAAGKPPFPGLPGRPADLEQAARNAEGVAQAADELKRVAPGSGAYISEADFFRADWREAFWGANYRRLREIKDRYDPDGLFFVHHGVGAEDWSADGFVRQRA